MAYRYVKKQGASWVIVDKAGKVLSKHRSRQAAEASFRAMMASKHGGAREQRWRARHKRAKK